MNAVAPERLPGLIGHELRNPLASALTGAMLVRDMIDDGDPRAAVVDGVLRDLDRIGALLDGWLRLARGQRTEQRTFAVDEMVAAAAARHGAEVVHGCPDAALCGDRGLLERALDNLCENARHAGARRIRLAAQTLGGEVTIHVEDDGVGIPADHLPHVFAPGWSSRGGAGLGLHAVQTIVEAHRGHVRCLPLPRGTRFSLTLPLAAARSAEA
ncbi:MAG: HAMP domain-containing histidine kinase [Planctomycetes bacterium]|nr:HAMP domain-containing histidine kinase [Planctomycetota bacterium]